ncbi:NAD(P)/FAD-dependent oxidoreductase [Halogeometricum borinquense]|uniref:NAD(P)/FAD-dependent oxidoreductase n=1 Tax=Halogeometricum borinquense TaxID=60847 RepID=A0A6C0UEQ2_9EURY|nr:NAD(P)/FAD-dependent oxidoreductase [Halogeometricum borinquense]QIB73647.1 NAD(P)/FAD-dependent oxidoreductase [Halogeometricum borinquense]QIQ76997.1 NAD(P)/FAD-dependent oxidoreductase [Halogeometricum borinquense]
MTEMGDAESYDVVVIGGGPAGLQTALYTARLGHDTAVVDRGGGRAAMMLDTHNVIGVTEEVSGNELLQTAREQVESYGADFHRDLVTEATRLDDGRFHLVGNNGEFVADRVVLGMGFNDERPEPPVPRTGKGLHYCLHCDAYMFIDRPVFVMGTGESAAHVAMIMLNFTDEVDILLRGEEPAWSEETDERLRAHPIDIIETEISGMRKSDNGWLEAFEFEDGTVRNYRGGFPMYGSNYSTDLAEQLGCDLNEDGTVAVSEDGETSVEGVYAVGDITPGHNQIPVAMGKGAQAGLAIHYELREFPRSLDDVRENGAVTRDEVPGLGDRIHAAADEFEEARAPPIQSPEVESAVDDD